MQLTILTINTASNSLEIRSFCSGNFYGMKNSMTDMRKYHLTFGFLVVINELLEHTKFGMEKHYKNSYILCK
jgi:hypothetical protein